MDSRSVNGQSHTSYNKGAYCSTRQLVCCSGHDRNLSGKEEDGMAVIKVKTVIRGQIRIKRRIRRR